MQTIDSSKNNFFLFISIKNHDAWEIDQTCIRFKSNSNNDNDNNNINIRKKKIIFHMVLVVVFCLQIRESTIKVSCDYLFYLVPILQNFTYLSINCVRR